MQPASDVKVEGDEIKSDYQDERIYLEGFRLVIVLASVTLVTFLVLLDTSILGTVSPRQTTGPI